MIACDFCGEWFHGDCVNITKKESKSIKNYYCDHCRETDSTLITVFKAKGAPPTPSLSLPPPMIKDKDLLKKKKDRCEARCGFCDGCRSRAMGKKGKCEKRLNYQQKKKEKKIKEGRIK